MKRKVIYTMDSWELENKIPYKALCEAWGRIDTLSAQRAMSELGIDKNYLKPLYIKSRKWHLYTGAPQNARFSPQELIKWNKVRDLLLMIN